MPQLNSKSAPLSWSAADQEEKLGAHGGRYTHTNTILSLLLAVIATAALYGVLIPNRANMIVAMFTDRGAVQYVTILFTIWALIILLFKSQKVRLQRRALYVPLVPEQGSFVLSAGTAHEVLDRIHLVCDNPVSLSSSTESN